MNFVQLSSWERVMRWKSIIAAAFSPGDLDGVT